MSDHVLCECCGSKLRIPKPITPAERTAKQNRVHAINQEIFDLPKTSDKRMSLTQEWVMLSRQLDGKPYCP